MPKDYKWIQRQAIKLSAIIVAVCLHSYFGFVSIAIMFWLKPVVIHAGFRCFFKIYIYYKLPSQNLRVLMGCETFLRCMYLFPSIWFLLSISYCSYSFMVCFPDANKLIIWIFSWCSLTQPSQASISIILSLSFWLRRKLRSKIVQFL